MRRSDRATGCTPRPLLAGSAGRSSLCRSGDGSVLCHVCTVSGSVRHVRVSGSVRGHHSPHTTLVQLNPPSPLSRLVCCLPTQVAEIAANGHKSQSLVFEESSHRHWQMLAAIVSAEGCAPRGEPIGRTWRGGIGPLQLTTHLIDAVCRLCAASGLGAPQGVDATVRSAGRRKHGPRGLPRLSRAYGAPRRTFLVIRLSACCAGAGMSRSRSMHGSTTRSGPLTSSKRTRRMSTRRLLVAWPRWAPLTSRPPLCGSLARGDRHTSASLAWRPGARWPPGP